MSITKEQDQRPALLDLLDQARPYAERMVYREGIVAELGSESGDAIDGALEVMGAWCRHAVADEYELIGNIEGNIFEAAYAMRDAGYVLGIAVGLLLRLPQSVQGVTAERVTDTPAADGAR
jgi:hypothetical protein